MVTLGMLWLPIVVSAVVVFVAGFVAWMVLPHHKSDWKVLPDEAAFAAAVNQQSPAAPGQYTFPFAATKDDWQSDEWKAKAERGPVGFLVLKPPGNPAMGKSLAIYFTYCLVLSVLAGYVGTICLTAGAEYLHVFRVVGTAAILGYSGALPSQAVWFGRSWSSTIKEIIDGIVYGLLTAGVFAWLWP